MTCGSDLTITGAQNVTVTGKTSSPPVISGATEISCTGDVLIKNTGTGMALSSPLVVTNAGNVTVTATTSSPTISDSSTDNGVTINCRGDVLLENKGTGLTLSGPKFVVTNAGNVTVTAAGSSPTISTSYSGDGVTINCSGDILLENTGTGMVFSGPKFVVTNAEDVTVESSSDSTMIGGTVEIDCTGDVMIENAGNNLAVSSSMKITKAANVTVKSKSVSSPTIGGAVEIDCTGNVLIENTGTGMALGDSFVVTNAGNVTVTATTSSPTIGVSSTNNGVSINCRGDVLLENKGTGLTLSGPKFVVTNAGNVTVTAAGSSPTISTSYSGDGVTINCSGDILLENTGTGMVFSGPKFVVTNAEDVTVESSSDSTMIGGTVEIDCTGDVMIENAGNNLAVSSNMKITKAANVTVKSKSVSSPTIGGTVEIDCTGNVLIENLGNYLTIASGMKITKAENVTVKSTSNDPTITGIVEINCTGNVLLENKGTGLTLSGPKFVVTNAGNVTVTAAGSSPTISTSYSGDGVTINCSGDILLENKGTGLALSGPKFVVSNAKAVTVKASSESPTISRTVEIDCTGDVMIENAGDGMAVTSGMKITKAENVTVKSKSVSSPTIGGTVEIDCTGNVLIENLGNYLTIASGMKITKAENVTVKSTSNDPTITGIVEINCTGNVLLENKGTGQAVYGSVTLHQKSGGTGYAVWTGEERAQLQLISEKENTESYTAERVSDSVIYVGSNDHKVTKIEAKDATCTKEGNQEHYLCSCGKIYQDALGLEEIKDPQSVKISATGHTDGSEWKKDDTAHWHECTVNGCGAVIESSKSGHTYTDDADTTCDVCGYVRTINKTPASDKNDNSEKSDSATGGVLYPCKTPTGTVSPKTGDSNQVFLWSLLLGVSVAGMYANRKKNCGMK